LGWAVKEGSAAASLVWSLMGGQPIRAIGLGESDPEFPHLRPKSPFYQPPVRGDAVCWQRLAPDGHRDRWRSARRCYGVPPPPSEISVRSNVWTRTGRLPSTTGGRPPRRSRPSRWRRS